MNKDSTINAMQAAMKAAVDNGTLIREKGEPKTPQQNGNDRQDSQQQQPPAPGATDTKPTGQQPLPDDLAARIKAKYNIDLPEDEILKRLGGNGSQPDATKPPISEKKRVQPKPEDISDDTVSKFFEKHKKPNLVAQLAEVKTKEDTALVRESHLAQIKAQFPDLKDTQIEALFNERYYIGEDDDFTAEEKKLGEWMIKNEAERLRNAVAFQVDGARSILFDEELTEYQVQEFAEAVDEFVKDQPDKMVLSLGKSGAIDLGDYEVPLHKDTIAHVRGLMRKPADLVKAFMDDKGGIDLSKMYNFYVKANLFDSAIRTTATDYYSKGVDAIQSRLDGKPNLDGKSGPEPKTTKKEEEEKAADFNRNQVGKNIGRGRIR